MKRTIITALTLLVALASGVWANFDFYQVKPQWVSQPDGTLIEYWTVGWHRTLYVDGYVFVSGDDGWYYYAELDARGDYVASPYKVRVDDPLEIGIPLNLQRSAVRQAEKDAAYLIGDESSRLIQPDGTTFHAFSGITLPSRNELEGGAICPVPADGYVIAIGVKGTPLINYNGGDPFWAFLYDEESGWYYYADCLSSVSGLCLQNARGDYVASPYKVGIDDPPGYNPAVAPGRSSPTAVQQRSWGAVKHLFHK